MIRLAAALTATLALLSAPAPTQAHDPAIERPPEGQCFEDVGCPWDHLIARAQLRRMSCENLSHVRNAIYRGHGYCFANRKVLADQVGAGEASERYSRSCRYRSPGEVPLNRFEKANAAFIAQMERQKRCPG